MLVAAQEYGSIVTTTTKKEKRENQTKKWLPKAMEMALRASQIMYLLK